ncbi:hypothetical protein HD842_001327 [Massilia aurea]|jgi:hypothetical protein|uniref:Uncharacterized protein n=1 Tax=Massilia aurea TaxID=373040 RepID=A0A7W9WYK5_9BURK|nr:hypothetical protein [Massilia aurea]
MAPAIFSKWYTCENAVVKCGTIRSSGVRCNALITAAVLVARQNLCGPTIKFDKSPFKNLANSNELVCEQSLTQTVVGVFHVRR